MGPRLNGIPHGWMSVTLCLFNSDNFATSAALAKVCVRSIYICSAILALRCDAKFSALLSSRQTVVRQSSHRDHHVDTSVSATAAGASQAEPSSMSNRRVTRHVARQSPSPLTVAASAITAVALPPNTFQSHRTQPLYYHIKRRLTNTLQGHFTESVVEANRQYESQS